VPCNIQGCFGGIDGACNWIKNIHSLQQLQNHVSCNIQGCCGGIDGACNWIKKITSLQQLQNHVSCNIQGCCGGIDRACNWVKKLNSFGTAPKPCVWLLSYIQGRCGAYIEVKREQSSCSFWCRCVCAQLHSDAAVVACIRPILRCSTA